MCQRGLRRTAIILVRCLSQVPSDDCSNSVMVIKTLPICQFAYIEKTTKWIAAKLDYFEVCQELTKMRK